MSQLCDHKCLWFSWCWQSAVSSPSCPAIFEERRAYHRKEHQSYNDPNRVWCVSWISGMLRSSTSRGRYRTIKSEKTNQMEQVTRQAWNKLQTKHSTSAKTNSAWQHKQRASDNTNSHTLQDKQTQKTQYNHKQHKPNTTTPKHTNKKKEVEEIRKIKQLTTHKKQHKHTIKTNTDTHTWHKKLRTEQQTKTQTKTRWT